MRKILCFIGWHKWTWLLSEAKVIDNNIPDFAKCEYCECTYRKINKDGVENR